MLLISINISQVFPIYWKLPHTTINASWSLMTSRLVGYPLVFQHGHKEWPMFDDLLLKAGDFHSHVN